MIAELLASVFRLRGRNKAYQDGFVYIDVAEVDEVIRKDHIVGCSALLGSWIDL